MFSLSRKTKSREKSPPPLVSQPSPEDSIARVAITETGIIAYASSSFAALAGYEPAELVNTDAAMVLRFPEAEQSFNNMGTGAQKIQLNGHRETQTFHFDWLTTPDRKRYLVGSAVPVAPQTDEKKLFENKILQARRAGATEAITDPQDLQRFANLTRDVMLVADAEGNILRVNNAFTALFGYSEAELAGISLVDLFHAEDRAFVRNAIQSLNLENHASGLPAEASAKAGALDFEARAVTKSGAERWMEWSQMQDGSLIYALGHDVTALRRQEKALLRRAGQLKEAESIGRMGHWRWQIGEEKIDWSDEIYRIFGVEQGVFKPTLDSMNAMINRRDIAKVNQAFQRAMMEQNDYDMEFRIKRPDGEERFIRCEGRCAVSAEGEAVALYGIMQDMTERMLHEKVLKEAKDAAERAYAAKSQFLANMSHELRTPLNAIIGFSEIMQQQLLGPIGTEKYLEYVRGILESGEHLLDMIGDILDMSKIEAGKYELMLEEVNVLKTTRLAVHMMESRAIDGNVKIVVAKPENENTIIIADRRAVLQILLNLLSNAVKFSNPGGRVQIEISPVASPAKAGAFVTIKIIDQGIGIPANKLASITRPFEQVSSHYTREHEGTGLGLAITKELVELHGGVLQIDSRVGAGTTATVRLPVDASKVQKMK